MFNFAFDGLRMCKNMCLWSLPFMCVLLFVFVCICVCFYRMRVVLVSDWSEHFLSHFITTSIILTWNNFRFAANEFVDFVYFVDASKTINGMSLTKRIECAMTQKIKIRNLKMKIHRKRQRRKSIQWNRKLANWKKKDFVWTTNLQLKKSIQKKKKMKTWNWRGEKGSVD